jgi:hypothetical protein
MPPPGSVRSDRTSLRLHNARLPMNTAVKADKPAAAARPRRAVSGDAEPACRPAAHTHTHTHTHTMLRCCVALTVRLPCLPAASAAAPLLRGLGHALIAWPQAAKPEPSANPAMSDGLLREAAKPATPPIASSPPIAYAGVSRRCCSAATSPIMVSGSPDVPRRSPAARGLLRSVDLQRLSPTARLLGEVLPVAGRFLRYYLAAWWHVARGPRSR